LFGLVSFLPIVPQVENRATHLFTKGSGSGFWIDPASSRRNKTSSNEK
jgi:hypothetical protein